MSDLILSLVRNEPFLTEDIQIVTPAGPHKAVSQVIKRAKALKPVTDAMTQNEAGTVAQELQGLRKGLEAQYNAAKAPFLAGCRACDRIYHQTDQPLKEAYDLTSAMVANFQAALKRKAELERAKIEAERLQREAEERARLAELERQRQAAEMKARMAEDPRERMDSNRAAQQLAGAAEEQRLAIELQREEFPVPAMKQAPKPVGGRVYDEYEITVIDIYKFASAHPELVEIKMKRGATKEAIKLLDQAGKPLEMPGLKIYKQPKAAFVGASAIRISKEE